MSIRRTGTEGIQQQTSVDQNQQSASKSTESSIPSPNENVRPPDLSETEKGRRLQESGLQGLTMRSQLESALPNAIRPFEDIPLNLHLHNLTPEEVAASGAERSLTAMSNDQLIQLADSPGGAQTLETMAAALKNGEMTPARQKQLDRIAAAQFKPAAGLKLQGSDADKATYMKMVRNTMMDSPSFAKTMNEINGDAAHPVNVTLGRNLPNRLDSFNEGRGQTIDLADLEKIPANPPSNHPESTTQGQVLSHAMREAREGALGTHDYGPAHKKAIEAENEYRKDIGQKSMRLMPPNDKHDISTPPFGSTIIVHYDDGHSDGLLFDQNGNMSGVNGNIYIPF